MKELDTVALLDPCSVDTVPVKAVLSVLLGRVLLAGTVNSDVKTPGTSEVGSAVVTGKCSGVGEGVEMWRRRHNAAAIIIVMVTC